MRLRITSTGPHGHLVKVIDLDTGAELEFRGLSIHCDMNHPDRDRRGMLYANIDVLVDELDIIAEVEPPKDPSAKPDSSFPLFQPAEGAKQ